MPVHLPPLLVPLPLLAAAAAEFLRPRRRIGRLLPPAEMAALLALAGAAVLAAFGRAGGAHPAGAWALPDAVGLTMLLLAAFLGWVVVRYAGTLLDGEPGQGRFMAWLCLALAAVQVLAVAGNLLLLVGAWVAASLFLHRLLLFHPERPGARRAARKKFITARLGDAALAGAAALLVAAYGTADIGAILAAARTGAGGGPAVVAAWLLALAACLKSAQFPTHGWLTEAMETPTPVSALLHAGMVNAGGFLLVRFADVMLLAPGALAALVAVGGATALIGALVMPTQPAVKTALAWSTVAQMGFMILECGLGLFPLALLHIVGHALYKAHAFLASGGAVERVSAARRDGPPAVPGPGAAALAVLAACAIQLAVGAVSGLWHEPPQAIALGAVPVLGVAVLLAHGFAEGPPWTLPAGVWARAIALPAGYCALLAMARHATAGVLPPAPPPGLLLWAPTAAVLLGFAAVAAAQATLPRWAGHPAAQRLRVHLMNGLYANALTDRLLGGRAAGTAR